ncbi:hypothetical protein [Spirochaeta dissipatitropha]
MNLDKGLALILNNRTEDEIDLGIRQNQAERTINCQPCGIQTCILSIG